MTEQADVTVFIKTISLEADLDRPLYRIFPVWALEDLVRTKCLTLMPPSSWEDPIEDMASKLMIVSPTKKQTSLGTFLKSAFAQCWSFESNSDSLIRAYSRVTIDPIYGRNTEPQREGVQVRTTARKLMQAVAPWASRSAAGSFYLGKIQYLPGDDEVGRVIGRLLAGQGPYALGRGDLRAQSLLLKRAAFRHEAEARLIFVCDERPPKKALMKVNVEPNELIDDIRFDPRLRIAERIERQETFRSLGYSGSFSDSGLYQGIYLMTHVRWEIESWAEEAPESSAAAPANHPLSGQ